MGETRFDSDATAREFGVEFMDCMAVALLCEFCISDSVFDLW